MLVHFWWWLQHITGLDNASGPVYLFWSGFFGDLTIFAAAIAIYWKHTCHNPGCYRISKHVINGSPYCNKHHEAARYEH